jgi:hypothetical protein
MKLLIAALVALAVVLPGSAAAQRATPIGISSAQAVQLSAFPTPAPSSSVVVATSSGMPRWLRWGLIGALGGAIIWTAADAGNSHTGSVVDHAVAGAVTGFILVGGGVAIYDAVCDSRRGGC